MLSVHVRLLSKFDNSKLTFFNLSDLDSMFIGIAWNNNDHVFLALIR